MLREAVGGVEDHLLLPHQNRAMVEDQVGVVRHHLRQALVEALYFRPEIQEVQEARHFPQAEIQVLAIQEAQGLHFLLKVLVIRVLLGELNQTQRE